MKKGETYTVRPIRVAGRLAYVTLTKGHVAVIDAADVPLVEGRNWYAQETATGVYAARSAMVDGRQRCILMHRVIAGVPDEVEGDHRDRDGLNNRRRNLRVASRRQNQGNKAAQASATGIKGVRFQAGKFEANIESDGRRYFLGRFTTSQEASAAYAGAARVLFGEFARVA